MGTVPEGRACRYATDVRLSLGRPSRHVRRVHVRHAAWGLEDHEEEQRWSETD